MPKSFILDEDLFIQLFESNHLKQAYTTRAQINNLDAPSPNRLWTSLGSKDTSTRNVQIKALNWLYNHFMDHLDFSLPEQDKSNDQVNFVLAKQNGRLKALRVLTSLCIFIIEHNKTGVLTDILKEHLGINSANQFDESTRAYCFKAAKEHFSKNGDLKLESDYDLSGIDFAFFAEFIEFINAQLNRSVIDKFPCASMFSVSLAWPMSMVGYSLGAIAGEALSRSTSMQNTQWTVTAAIGSIVYMVMGPSAGITLLAPTIAGKAISNTCGLSLAWALGKTFGYAGKTVGAVAGMPLDMVWKIALASSSTVGGLMWTDDNVQFPEKGISLVNGQLYIQGEILEIKPLTKAEEETCSPIEYDDKQAPAYLAELEHRLHALKNNQAREQVDNDLEKAPPKQSDTAPSISL